MSKKRIARAVLASSFTAALFALPATPALAAPASPGACNMLNVGGSHVGFAGMVQSSNGQGFENMVELVIASEEAGCEP